jgi:hypothetical protein
MVTRCAASSIGIISRNNVTVFIRVAVVSRFLPIPVVMTSAHAEYEGLLLLGLEWLCDDEMPKLGEYKIS